MAHAIRWGLIYGLTSAPFTIAVKALTHSEAAYWVALSGIGIAWLVGEEHGRRMAKAKG